MMLQEKIQMSLGAYEDIKYRLHNYILAEIDREQVDLHGLPGREISTYVSARVLQFLEETGFVVNSHDVSRLTEEMVHEITGYGPLEGLINDESIDDILVNGPGKIFIEREGKLELSQQRFIDDQHILRVIRRILAPLGRRIDESSPIVDARLPDGSRINAIIPPLALDGTCLSIRKFSRKPILGDDLIRLGTLNQPMLDFLIKAATHKVNIMISGGTGSGKTTILNLLSYSILDSERLVTIEDAAELKLNHNHVVRLETRPANLEGQGEVTAQDLVRNALRMRPDRIILGEIRGREVMDVLQAMNTGHEGSMSTIHANNPNDALLRIEMLAGMAGFRGAEQTLRKMIAASIELIVQVARLPNGERKVTSIVEVIGIRDDAFVMNELWRYDRETKAFVSSQLRAHNPKVAEMGPSPAFLRLG